jgi:hypothetical protein
MFLNTVLTKVIDRFEVAFPECRDTKLKPKDSDYEPTSSDEDDDEEDAMAPPSPTLLRRSSSMTEIARGLELEEGDVHRFNSLLRKRDIVGAETELTGQQLLEAILKVDKETVEREVWDKDGLRKVLTSSIDAGVPVVKTQSVVEETSVPSTAGIAREQLFLGHRKKDSDSHSI